MRDWRIHGGIALCLFLCAIASCGGSTVDSGTGSETNWIFGCSEERACSAGDCICGVCTSACGDETPCADGLRCVADGSTDFAEVCRDQISAPGLCLAECAEGRPCLNGFRCEDGLCKPQPIARAGGGPVGAPCVASSEGNVTFSGFSAEEISLDTRFRACASEICLILSFQGRVSCPYGQKDPSELSCFATDSGEPVTVAVEPQLVSRPPEDAVYCSCRCGGPPDNGPFCACPDGFECRPVIADLGLGSARLAGSYCVKTGTWVNDPRTLSSGSICDRALNNCSDR